MQQQQPSNGTYSVRGLTNTSFGCFQVAAVTLEVFLHQKFGERYIKNRTGVAVVLMLLFMCLYIPYVHNVNVNPRPFGYFLGAFIVLSLVAQMGAVIRRWRGKETHTRYTGTPYLMWLFPRANEVAIKVLEPFVVFGIGLLVRHFDRLLGAYLMAASFALFMSVITCVQERKAQRMDINDAIIEQSRNAASVRRVQRN